MFSGSERIKECPLGIFDSGIGGLTVLRKIIETLPGEDTVYLGDTARLPYGERSSGTIIHYSLQNAAFLHTHHIKMLVVACNTASAYAVDSIKDKYSLPVIDVIGPAVERALELSKSERIAVLGTKATIRSNIYAEKIRKVCPGVEVISQACPLFVPLVEENYIDHPATSLIVREYLSPLKHKKVDTVILGCTHYPLISHLIQEELGGEVHIIDSASACAAKIAESLEENHLKRNLLHKGKSQYYASDDPDKFRRMGEGFLGIPIENVGLYRFD